MSYIFSLFLIFFVGLCIGSFLGVVIDRFPRGESVIFISSHCDKCKKSLFWYDLIPLFSFIILGGICRYCHKKISPRHPVVELLTGIIYLVAYISINRFIDVKYHFADLVYFWVVSSCFIIIFFIDLKHRIIPDRILAFLVVISIIYIYRYDSSSLPEHFFIALVAFLLFFLIVVITRGRGMGFGDVKLAGVLGLIIGVPVIVSFYIAFLTGAVISLILILKGRKKMKETIPFGPFLVSGAYASLIWGENMWNIFKRILGLP